VAGPEEIAVGKLVPAEDPLGNLLVLPEESTGHNVTGGTGRVTGAAPRQAPGPLVERASRKLGGFLATMPASSPHPFPRQAAETRVSMHLSEGKGAAVPTITVSPARLAHLTAIAQLLDEMARFYGTATAGPVDQRHRQVREALFATPPAARALLACDQSRLAGIARYSFLWPAAGLTCSLYLKELYVATAYRHRGIGTLLISSLIEVASEHGCSRVEWTADSASAAAQAFYSKLGIPPLPSKIFYRIEDNGSGLQLPS